MPKNVRTFNWPHFDERRTKLGRGDITSLVDNFTALSIPSGANHYDALVEFGRSSVQNFRIKYLSDRLKEYVATRRETYFDTTGEEIERILSNYPCLRWWIERDGLVVDIPMAEVFPLSDFDEIAGSLFLEHAAEGTLSGPSLSEIAKCLDRKGFRLRKHLQPVQWAEISDFNQKHPRIAIKSFGAATANCRFGRLVRRRLYVARDRYKKSRRPVEAIHPDGL